LEAEQVGRLTPCAPGANESSPATGARRARSDAPYQPDPLGLFPKQAKDRPEILFLELIRPLIAQGLERLSERARALEKSQPTSRIAPEGLDWLAESLLPGRLLGVLARTMTLELNVARVQGLLEGQTGEERFASFINRLRQPEVRLEFFREYPVL